MDPAVMSYHLGRAHNELSQMAPAVMMGPAELTCGRQNPGRMPAESHGASRNDMSPIWGRW
jgi:hypothetical protein